jgi:putative redox protein
MENHMISEKVTAEWQHDQVFMLRDQHGYPIKMSQPDGVLGADLLPLSLIGCAIWDVTNILHKQKQVISRMEVEAFSERDYDPPWRFRKIRVLYRIWGTQVKRAAVERAIRLTEEKYCSIYVTLKPAIEIVSEFEILTDDKITLGTA